MTGLWFRVQRDGKWINIQLEHCTPEERIALLKGRSEEWLKATIEILCATIYRADELFKELANDGVIKLQSDQNE